VIDLEWCSLSGPWQIVKVRGSICTWISLHWSAIGLFFCWVYQSSKEANVWSARGPLVIGLLPQVVNPPTFHCLSLSLQTSIYKIQNKKKRQKGSYLFMVQVLVDGRYVL